MVLNRSSSLVNNNSVSRPNALLEIYWTLAFLLCFTVTTLSAECLLLLNELVWTASVSTLLLSSSFVFVLLMTYSNALSWDVIDWFIVTLLYTLSFPRRLVAEQQVNQVFYTSFVFWFMVEYDQVWIFCCLA